MRIGIDFDNTIACYDSLFHKMALRNGLIPQATPVNKVAVRDHLRNAGKEPVWTELQGLVYGKHMDEADIYPGVHNFIVTAIEHGHEVNIVSHKTRHPVIGPRYDLHHAARHWIELNLILNGKQLLTRERLFFEPTREAKLARIERCGCEIFIDDLPEILTAPTFPSQTSAILFDPEGHHAMPDLPVYSSWFDIMKYVGIAFL